jgi:SAM-dependent methyltransferase
MDILATNGARSASASRLTRYLRQPKPPSILELGRKWLVVELVKSDIMSLCGSLHELNKPPCILTEPNLSFLDADIFSAPFAPETFDVILLASVIQYFRDLPALLNGLFPYLKPQGEIHIVDSPLYTDAEMTDAVHRSRQYYSSLGFPEMAGQYFHHCISDLNVFDPQWNYRPRPHPRWKRCWSLCSGSLDRRKQDGVLAMRPSLKPFHALPQNMTRLPKTTLTSRGCAIRSMLMSNASFQKHPACLS